MKKLVTRLICILTILIVSIGGLHVASASAQTEESSETENLNVLLMGIDTGDLGRVETGRSDVLVLMTLDQADQQITLTSIPRDSYVNIPGYGMDKVNHAYAYGGPELSMQTVSEWLGVDVSDYVAVNMAGLQEIVEAVGGITVTPPTTFTIGEYTFYEGEPTELNGEAALAYVRERYTSGGDYGRQGRQRQVITAIIEKGASLESLANIKNITGALSNNIETSYNPFELLDLFTTYNSLSDQITTYQLTGYGQTIDGIYYEVIDDASFAELQTIIQPEV